MQLDTDLRRSLHAALLDAYPSWDDLELLASLGLGVNLEQVSSRDKPLGTVVLRLILRAESEDTVRELVAAALENRSGNRLLLDFRQQIEGDVAREAPVAARRGRLLEVLRGMLKSQFGDVLFYVGFDTALFEAQGQAGQARELIQHFEELGEFERLWQETERVRGRAIG